MYQQTSLFAYKEVKANINKRHRQILESFSAGIPLNNRQISTITGLPINCVTPRCLELRKFGAIELAQKGKDQETGRTVIFWRKVGGR